ncbi:beta-propeller domain-containing protein [Hyphomonas sp.]|uniref:beta-propeller domain-containing protein n=1 Tax=Hyphomonas sp. TaxID=87 RepID=UPI001D42319D|nr:beta-propeller domain-containing protein [Hyphomonas sp.]MBU3919515.1 beta-propeller domain-containing protein [Alphaproteobacteria bacterium]MBU4063310.1 beta-propeller domain-containing protein [Alphaproteobacteria bacterium]MBU4164128.1 beta-propeller domain-containing protein [Alphaproteobacteria bacterium]
MRLVHAASLAALMMALTACTSLYPWVHEPQAETLVETAPVNRFESVELADAQTRVPAYADPALNPLRSATLTRFRSEKEFLDWLTLARAAAKARGVYGWHDAMPMMAMAEPAEAEAPGTESAAPVADGAMESVTVTGSAVGESETNPEITNNQKAGVDEGGIVKQIGNHLVVLQDGRLFVTDLMPGGKPGLKLADRANVYRSSNEDTWYDEMLVAGRTILVTGYSYAENASEFSVLTLGEDGKVTRDATFYISSDDYYSGSNYASRMIDGKLVIHTPIYTSGRGWWDTFDPPEIREWRREGPDGEREHLRGQPLFRAEDIWMPVQRVLEPVIHTVTVCDISGVTDASAPACKSTAIVGSEAHEFLVTKDAFWLWLSPSWSERAFEVDEAAEAVCTARKSHAPLREVAPSTLVKLPIDGTQPSVLGVRGMPQNQFSMDMDAGTFRAVVDWHSDNCDGPYGAPATLTYFDTPLTALSNTLSDDAGGRYVPLPSPGTTDYEARFTEAHLVYGAREGWGSWAPEEGEEPRDDGRAIVVPVENPTWPITLTVPHDVIRAERAGPYMALTGYRDARGLSVSLIDLRLQEPKVSGTFVMENRYESENRSHAFNSRIGADGQGLIGLPTVSRSEESERWWWWSASSDLSYLQSDADGTLSKAGDLIAARRDPNEESPTGYECEVSCVDWYGNARPIFTGGRVLALVNSELIEGELKNGTVQEVRRIDLTAKPD